MYIKSKITYFYFYVNIHALYIVSFLGLPMHVEFILLRCAVNIPLNGNSIVYFLIFFSSLQFGGFAKNL